MQISKLDANALKIAIDTSPLISGHAARGIGVYTKNLIKYLKLESSSKVEIHTFEKLKTNPQLLITNYQLLHYPYFDLFFNSLPVVKPVKTIITIHDVIPLIYPDHYPPGVKGRLRFLVQKYSLRSVSAVLTDSEASKKDIIKFLDVPEEKIKVIYLAPDEIYKPVTDKIKLNEVKQKYNLPDKFVLYVGDINYNKNIPNLVKACKELEIPCVIVGKKATEKNVDRNHPENKDLVWLQDYSAQHPREVILSGFVPEEELRAIYSLATVYCQPSLYEGFGLPVLEAMACGCPVACSNGSSLPEICGEAAMMFEPTLKGISEGIKKVFTNPKVSCDLREKGFDQAKIFTWRKTAREVLDVYKKYTSE